MSDDRMVACPACHDPFLADVDPCPLCLGAGEVDERLADDWLDRLEQDEADDYGRDVSEW